MKFLVTLYLILFSFLLYGQENKKNPIQIDRFTIGLGVGLDYGGLGINFLTYPSKNIGLFGGFGMANEEIGYNYGFKFRFFSDEIPSKINPFALAMYGKNTTIIIENKKSLNKSFNYPTIGFGLDVGFNYVKTGYLSFAILIPIRGEAYTEYKELLTSKHSVKFENSQIPINISIGYRLIIGSTIKK